MAVTNGPSVKVDLTIPSYSVDLGGGKLIDKTTLDPNTILQSFVVDYQDTKLYIAQCKKGNTNPDQGATQGDVNINHVNADGSLIATTQCLGQQGWDGISSEYYYNREFNNYNYQKTGVRGWGHGTQIAMEYAPDGKFIWLDYDCPMVDRLRDKGEAITDYYVTGTRLARIPIGDIADTFYYDDSRLRTFTLTSRIAGIVGGTNFATVSIDNVNHTMAVKYMTDDDVMKVTIFSMTYNDAYPTSHKMSDIVFTELKTFVVPVIKWAKAGNNGYGKKSWGNLVPNGWVIFGDYIYFQYGSSYWSKSTTDGQQDWYCPTPTMVTNGCYYYDTDGNYIQETVAGNMHISRYNWVTGVEEQRFHTQMGSSYTFRESEGMGIFPYFDANGNVIKLRLMSGLATGVSGARTWSLMEKVADITVAP